MKRSRQHPDGCFFKLHKYADPVDFETALASHDDATGPLAALDRLPARPAHGPAMPWTSLDTAWERKQAAAYEDCLCQWRHFDYPEALDPAKKQCIGEQLTTLTRAWIEDSRRGVQTDEDVVFRWFSYLETADPEEHAALWVFLVWGQRELLDLCDELDDVDIIESLEADFLEVADTFPMWHLLHKFELLAHAMPPPEPALDDLPLADTRNHVVREPMPEAFALQNTYLQPWADRKLIGTSFPQGVPVVRAADGSLHMYCLHLFAGRRRPGDCHSHLESINKEVFPELTIHLWIQLYPASTAIYWQKDIAMLNPWPPKA